MTNHHQKAMQVAMRLLSRRNLSIKELEQSLLQLFSDNPECDALVSDTITRLKELNIVSDHRTAESIARRHEMKGDRFIRQKLEQAGIDTLCAKQAIAELGDEVARAQEAALKKRNSIKDEQPQNRQEKLFQFLAARGFASETCYKVSEKLIID